MNHQCIKVDAAADILLVPEPLVYGKFFLAIKYRRPKYYHTYYIKTILSGIDL